MRADERSFSFPVLDGQGPRGERRGGRDFWSGSRSRRLFEHARLQEGENLGAVAVGDGRVGRRGLVPSGGKFSFSGRVLRDGTGE